MADMAETLSLIFPILGVVGVILCAHWATRYLARRGASRPGGRRVQVLERVPMSKDASLALIRVDDRTYLMSVGPGRVERICVMDEPGTGAARDSFASQLSDCVRAEAGEVQP